MNKIYVIPYTNNEKCNSKSEIHNWCILNNVEKLKELIDQNTDIYSCDDSKEKISPMTFAMHSKNEALILLLLDIYERDLSALDETEFKKALIAYPKDQTEELLKHCKKEPTSKCVPVLLKNDNQSVPKLVYLSKILENKDDLSLTLIKKLTTKKSFVDLNYKVDDQKNTLLHLAIYYRYWSVFFRLLHNPKVDKKLENSLGQNQLHFAIGSKFSVGFHQLIDLPEYKRWIENPSYIYQAAVSGKRHLFGFILGEFLDLGKTKDEVVNYKFPVNLYFHYPNEIEGNFFHVFAAGKDSEFFTNPVNYKFTKEHYNSKASNGMTMLHILVLNSEMNLKSKINAIKKLCESQPQLLSIKDDEGQLPLHYAAYNDTHGHNLYKILHKLTTKVVVDEKELFS
ncbi:hypothetical protein PVAND_008658 [Polypedilum vanderplanki]|uniref:Ankyrin repeat protein n=1 Tax=Polypedilum vanderplanki TaxID=319348 RepID=A0A9J6CAX5_POLVA|nr:hypothetical protein PVAND_008658 [Polypedilum vanderplanki]